MKVKPTLRLVASSADPVADLATLYEKLTGRAPTKVELDAARKRLAPPMPPRRVRG